MQEISSSMNYRRIYILEGIPLKVKPFPFSKVAAALFSAAHYPLPEVAFKGVNPGPGA
jgi:hypothetical protein